MIEEIFKCNKCEIFYEGLFCLNAVNYPCDDPKEFINERWDMSHHESTYFQLLCEQCYFEAILEHPLIQNKIQKRYQQNILQIQSCEIFKQFVELNDKIKIQLTECQQQINIDYVGQLNEFHIEIESLLDEKYSNLIGRISTNIENEIKLSKDSLAQIQKSRDLFKEQNKNLIDNGKFNLSDMNYFFDKQIEQLNILKKEKQYTDISYLLQKHEQPQNQVIK